MHTSLFFGFRVIGMGNAWRGDDAAGLAVARRLAATPWPGVRVMACRGDAGELQAAWQGAQGVIVVDAVVSRRPPGTIHRLDALAAGIPLEFSRSPSSHGWGLAAALALGRVLRELPPMLVIYGIEGQEFNPGRGLSPEVAAAVPEAARRIREEIFNWQVRLPRLPGPPAGGAAA
jgi:hydrogenase maturation protease